MFSSKTENWATPPELFAELHKEFNFNLDVCASNWNNKLPNYFTKEQNALVQEWAGSVFMNPPYGREIGKWIRKAYEESLKGSMVVCLIPARTDTAYWHDYVMKGEIRFIRGRIKFIDKNGNSHQSAPFPSAIVIFNNKNNSWNE